MAIDRKRILKFLVIVGCLLAIANVGVFAGLIAPAPLVVKPAIALPIATAPIIKQPWIASAPAWGIAQPSIGWGAAPLGLGLKLG